MGHAIPYPTAKPGKNQIPDSQTWYEPNYHDDDAP